MITSTDLNALAKMLFQSGAFLDKTKSEGGKGFKLKLHEKNPDAPLSPFYFNLRTRDNPKPGPLTAQNVRQVALCMYYLATGLGAPFGRWERIAGVPNAGDPFAEAFAALDKRERSLIRLEKKSSGSGRKVVGIARGERHVGDRILLIDDLITKADSKLEAIAVLESEGLRVEDVLVILDREQGGRKQLFSGGYRLHSLFKLSELVERYFREGLISISLRNEIMAYASQN